MKKNDQKLGSWLVRLASKDIRVVDGHIDLVAENENEQQTHHLRNRLAPALFLLLFFMIAGWATASIYLPKVRLGNSLVSLRQSDADLQSRIQQAADNYKLSISYPDGSKKSFSLAAAGMEPDASATLLNVRNRQHQWSNRLAWWQPVKADIALKTDSSRLNKFITEQATVTIQPPKDGTLSLDHGTIKLTDSSSGKHYGLEEPTAILRATASGLKTTPLNLKILSTRPAITTGQLARYQTQLQKMLKQTVTFTIDGQKFPTSSEDIADWLELTSENSGKSINITVNSGKVLTYINKISAGLTHPPKAQIEVKNADGSSTVLVKGVDGTDILNKDAVASEAAQNLLQDKSVEAELSVKHAGYKTISAQAYDKWIEVDTTNKRMYAYEKASLMRTFLVSAGAPKTPTVTGQFAIYAKYSQQDMRGQNVDGSSYFQPKVPWVNYFYADYAIHGNYWRPLSYFGNINSSHGCVGIVESDAQWIYSWSKIGTPVIVHT